MTHRVSVLDSSSWINLAQADTHPRKGLLSASIGMHASTSFGSSRTEQLLAEYPDNTNKMTRSNPAASGRVKGERTNGRLTHARIG